MVAMTPASIPENLGPQGTAFWQQAVREREFVESHDLRRLELACRILDEIYEDEERLRKDGRYVRGRYHVVPHPALRTLTDLRTTFLRAIRELGLDLVQAEDPRQPRLY